MEQTFLKFCQSSQIRCSAQMQSVFPQTSLPHSDTFFLQLFCQCFCICFQSIDPNGHIRCFIICLTERFCLFVAIICNPHFYQPQGMGIHNAEIFRCSFFRQFDFRFSSADGTKNAVDKAAEGLIPSRRCQLHRFIAGCIIRHIHEKHLIHRCPQYRQQPRLDFT